MKISDILRSKGDNEPITTPADTTVRELVGVLVGRRIGAVVVVADGGVAGIVSERDVIRGLDQRGTDTLDIEVRELMTVDVVSCAPDDEVDEIAATMTERRIRHMPVLAGGGLVGVVSIGDVVKSRIGELETEREHLEQYLTS